MDYTDADVRAFSVMHTELHLEGWSRAQAIDFLSRHTVRTPDAIAAAVGSRDGSRGNVRREPMASRIEPASHPLFQTASQPTVRR